MKKIIYLFGILLAGDCAFGQLQLGSHKWSVAVKVVDENGQPVEGANISAGYSLTVKESEKTGKAGAAVTGITDAFGMFHASHTDSSWGVGIDIDKAGYYHTHWRHDLYVPGQFDAQTVAASRNPTVTLTLKKIGKPIAMYAKNYAMGLKLPEYDKPIAYDLMVGDWIAPYGKGINKDILFTGHFDKKAGGESDYTLTVSFPNKGDGIQEFSVDKSQGVSELRSPHEAPETGYQSQWIQFDNRKPNKPVETNNDLNRNYIFRVRTKLDENGNIVSARYGKIYGDFMQFTYYFNPMPNDRNIEFDPKQNLLPLGRDDLPATAP